MKVLWYEVSVPHIYNNNHPGGGWQDSLEWIVRQHNDFELTVCFEGKKGMAEKVVDDVKYIPITPNLSFLERKIKQNWEFGCKVGKLLPLFKTIVEEVKPDLIHIFGTEWGLGQIANYTKVSVVTHIMGNIAAYNNATYPPGYSVLDQVKASWYRPHKLYQILKAKHFNESWAKEEQKNFEAVKYYMGRTEWDKSLCELFHPGCHYYKVNEALRPAFISSAKDWNNVFAGKRRLRLVSVGCSTHWKGMDVLLKTANVLKQHGVDFEWNVAGQMADSLQKEIETKEHLKFENCNVNILGLVQANKLIDLLLSSNVYVHTSYIDNSPNAVCEAQYLGLPVIATYVGGVPSLIDNRKDGLLIPANDPYQLASVIIRLSNNMDLQKSLSNAAKVRARERHNPENVYNELIGCYREILHNN